MRTSCSRLVWLAAMAAWIAPVAVGGEEFLAGHVLVSDRGGNEVVEYTEFGKVVRRLGNGEQGFVEPWGLAFGPDGRLNVVASGSGDLFRISGDGKLERRPNDGALANPRGLCVGAGGRLLVASHGNDSIVVVGVNGATESVVACPAGLGQPVAVGLDPAGRTWVASEEGPALYALSDEGEVTAGPIMLPGPPADLAFLGGWVVLVSQPTLEVVLAYQAPTGIGGGESAPTAGGRGLCLTNDGSNLRTLSGSAGVVRDWFGPMEYVDFGQGTLVDPEDVVSVPWRFRVTIRGRGYSSETKPPEGKHGTKVVDQAVLSLYPGCAQLLVEFDGKGPLASAEWLGQANLVLQGGGQISYWSLEGRGRHAVKRLYTEARLAPEAIQASVVINHTLPENEKNYWYSVVRGVGGRLVLGRGEVEREVVFTGRIVSAKLLNEP